MTESAIRAAIARLEIASEREYARLASLGAPWALLSSARQRHSARLVALRRALLAQIATTHLARERAK